MRPDQKFMAKIEFNDNMLTRDITTYKKYQFKECVVFYRVDMRKNNADMIIKTKKGFKGYSRRKYPYYDGIHTTYDYTLYSKVIEEIMTGYMNVSCQFIDKELMKELKEWRILQSI